MKASGIITVLGGVGALALLGLMVVMGGDATEPVRPPISEARLGTSARPGAAGQPSEAEQVLEVARSAGRPDDRISALRWLGNHGTPQQLDALRDIQKNDPSPEVRAAAELALSTLRTRRADASRNVNLPSP